MQNARMYTSKYIILRKEFNVDGVVLWSELNVLHVHLGHLTDAFVQCDLQ